MSAWGPLLAAAFALLAALSAFSALRAGSATLAALWAIGLALAGAGAMAALSGAEAALLIAMGFGFYGGLILVQAAALLEPSTPAPKRPGWTVALGGFVFALGLASAAPAVLQAATQADPGPGRFLQAEAARHRGEFGFMDPIAAVFAGYRAIDALLIGALIFAVVLAVAMMRPHRGRVS